MEGCGRWGSGQFVPIPTCAVFIKNGDIFVWCPVQFLFQSTNLLQWSMDSKLIEALTFQGRFVRPQKSPVFQCPLPEQSQQTKHHGISATRPTDTNQWIAVTLAPPPPFELYPPCFRQFWKQGGGAKVTDIHWSFWVFCESHRDKCKPKSRDLAEPHPGERVIRTQLWREFK